MLYMLVLLGLAFAVRLYRLGTVELWFDEAASNVVGSLDFTSILNYVRQAPNEHPPLYYLSLHAWMLLTGFSEFSMRYLSLCLGIVFVALIYRVARREFGVPFGLCRLRAAL